MVDSSLINQETLRAYQATNYRFDVDQQEIILNIGKYSNQLAMLFYKHDVNCGAFITAFNPQGKIQSDQANEQAHVQLLKQLQDLGIESFEGSGSEAGTQWPAERSHFALGLELETASTLGRHFNQDAIVWVSADAVPQLILLR